MFPHAVYSVSQKMSYSQKLEAIFVALVLRTGATFDAPSVCNTSITKKGPNFPVLLFVKCYAFRETSCGYVCGKLLCCVSGCNSSAA